MRKRQLLLISAVAISSAIAFTPKTNSIRLDGVISDSEWKDAKEYDLTGGGRVMMKKENSGLYVALVSGKRGWVHVYVSHKDTVRILHASAALGEARYVKQNDLWRSVQSFKWELRERVYNDELAKKQEDYYRQYGWVANNSNTGSGTTFEFKLDISRTDNNPAPFACLFAEIPSEAERQAGNALFFHYFPSALNDNTILQRLVQGYTPDSLQFNPKSWQQVR